MRNYKDLDTFVDVVSAACDKKTLLQIYNAAAKEPLSLFYVQLTSKEKEEVFYKRFDHTSVITTEGE